MHQRRGVQAEAGAEGQARQRGAAEPRERPHPSIADGTAEMHLGEEVAATFKSLVSYDMESFFCVWLQMKAVSATNTI